MAIATDEARWMVTSQKRRRAAAVQKKPIAWRL